MIHFADLHGLTPILLVKMGNQYKQVLSSKGLPDYKKKKKRKEKITLFQ